LLLKKEILQEAYNDREFAEKLEGAKDLSEIAKILEEFCKKKGYKIKKMAL